MGDTKTDPNENIKYESLKLEISRLRKWIDDCQTGMYINCVYCGFRYGPRDVVPATLKDKATPSMQKALQQHIEICPEHPMSKLKKENEEIIAENKRLDAETKQCHAIDNKLITERMQLRRENERLKGQVAELRRATARTRPGSLDSKIEAFLDGKLKEQKSFCPILPIQALPIYERKHKKSRLRDKRESQSCQ